MACAEPEDIDAALGGFAARRRGKPKYFRRRDGIRGGSAVHVACAVCILVEFHTAL